MSLGPRPSQSQHWIPGPLRLAEEQTGGPHPAKEKVPGDVSGVVEKGHLFLQRLILG